MSLLDHFPEDEQPAEDWSLMEEAAQFAPPLWKPAHVEPEGLTTLPEDFPVLDPFGGERPRLARLREALIEYAVCKTKDCPLEDREVLVRGIAQLSVQYIEDVQSIVAVLFAHGETLVADLVLQNIDALTEDILRPFFESVGLEVEDDL